MIKLNILNFELIKDCHFHLLFVISFLNPLNEQNINKVNFDISISTFLISYWMIQSINKSILVSCTSK